METELEPGQHLTQYRHRCHCGQQFTVSMLATHDGTLPVVVMCPKCRQGYSFQARMPVINILDVSRLLKES